MAKRSGKGRRARPEREPAKNGDGDSPEPDPNALTEWVKSLAIAAVIFVVLRTFLLQTFVITSGSMEDTLRNGDFLVVNRAAIGSRIPFTRVRVPGYSEVHRYDVVVFDPHHDDTLKLVKRLIGLPGDTLEMRDRVLYLNGSRLDEPYVKHVDGPDDPSPEMLWQIAFLVPGVDASSYRPSRDNWGPVVVPPDHYMMLGDNREQSYDSRYWGFLESWRVEGRALFIYFSYNRDSYRAFPFVREINWSRIGDPIR